jgi:endoglucanase
LGNLRLNCVRYCINYQLFAEDNPEREANLQKLKGHIERFASLNIYTILTLFIAPGLDSQNDGVEIQKPGPDRIRSVFEDNERFREWVLMWKFVASEVKDIPGLAGYEVINEPRVPCRKEGGATQFQSRLSELCQEIRKMDPDHILLVPEQHSREADLGEQYWNPTANVLQTDKGEQGIIWEHAFHKVDASNVAYVFHFYDPYPFTARGEGNYDPTALASSIQKRIDWAEKNGPFPVIVTEYGITRANSSDKRTAWMKIVHELFGKYGISSTYWVYKGPIGAHMSTDREYFPLWGEWISWPNEIDVTEKGYQFKTWVVEPAKKNRFPNLVEQYFWKQGKLNPLSLLDNGPIVEKLQKYWKE